MASYSQLRVHIYPSEGRWAAAMVVRHRAAGSNADRLLWRGDVDVDGTATDDASLLRAAAGTLNEIALSLGG